MSTAASHALITPGRRRRSTVVRDRAALARASRSCSYTRISSVNQLSIDRVPYCLTAKGFTLSTPSCRSRLQEWIACGPSGGDDEAGRGGTHDPCAVERRGAQRDRVDHVVPTHRLVDERLPHHVEERVGQARA